MRPHHRRDRGQQGAALILAFMALVVLLVVAGQIRFSASVEADYAGYFVRHRKLSMLADAARRQAESVLLVDLEDALAGGDQGQGQADLSGGDADTADVVAQTDSRLDEWMNPGALAPAMGEGLQVFVEVVDEDSKLNLLGLWTENEEDEDAYREILVRLLDVAFEGTSRDLGYADATEFLDRLDEWQRGSRGLYETVPLPLLKRTDEQEESEILQLETAIFDANEGHFPLTLDELLLIGGLTREHMRGFVENDEFYPGLDEYLTLYSHLELKQEPEGDDFFAASPMGGGESSQPGAFGTGPTDTGVGEGDEEVSVNSPTHDGLVNINTAKLPVLRAIARDGVPLSALELIIEFRDKVDELKEDELSGSSFFDDPSTDTQSGDDQGGGEGGDQGRGDGGFASGFGGAEEEKTAADYVFVDPVEVFGKIEDEFRVQVAADDMVKDDFARWFWVESQVFTIKVMVHEPPSEGDGEGVRRNYRTMVWRMDASDRPRILTLMPLEPYEDPRRLDRDFPQDLEDLSEERFLAPTGGRAGVR
jgi:type II secretory pathway component PulK